MKRVLNVAGSVLGIAALVVLATVLLLTFGGPGERPVAQEPDAVDMAAVSSQPPPATSTVAPYPPPQTPTVVPPATSTPKPYPPPVTPAPTPPPATPTPTFTPPVPTPTPPAPPPPPEILFPTQANQGPPWIDGTRVVWTDYRSSSDGRTNQSIVVFDLQTRQAQVIVGGSLDDGTPVVRFARGISGDIVVWEQETRRACDTCPRDIYGFNLATGEEFPIAVGEADYSTPSISGNRVVWRSFDGQTQAIEGLDLATGEQFQVTRSEVGNGFYYRHPVIDGSTVVWAEESSGHKSPTTTIYALDLATGRKVTVASRYMQGAGYDVSGGWVVWTDPTVHLFDLNTGQSRVLFEGGATNPAIDGALIVWADSIGVHYTDWDIFGYDLKADRPFLISADIGEQNGATVQGERVLWRDYRTGHSQIVMLELNGQRPVLPAPRPPTPQSQELPQSRSLAETAKREEAGEALLGSMPADLWKGMHAANGDGWGIASPAPTDAIVDDTGNPHFNYFTVLDSDLYRPTGYPEGDPRGDEVGDLFETIRDKGGYVMVRLFPTKEPCPEWWICDNPEDVAQQYITLASNTRGWEWINMVQIWAEIG